MQPPPLQDVYPDAGRLEVSEFLPASARSALDVGCARGGFGHTLRATLGAHARIVGLEPVRRQAELARNNGAFDDVLDGFFPDDVPTGERFDLVCFLDVLEHTIDPETFLSATHQLLTPEGRVLASIPSIQYWPVLWKLVRHGRWDYTDTGTLDRTHLRFFTRATMVELFERQGYVVESCVGIGSFVNRWETDPLSPRRWLKRRIRDRLLADRQFLQFVIVARSATDVAEPEI